MVHDPWCANGASRFIAAVTALIAALYNAGCFHHSQDTATTTTGASTIATATTGSTVTTTTGTTTTQLDSMGTQPLPKPLEPKPPATYNNYDLHLIRHDPQQGEEDTSIKEAVPGVRVHYFDNLNWGAEIKIYAFGDERVLKLSQGGSGTVKFGANTVHLTLNHYSATEIVVSVDVVEPQ